MEMARLSFVVIYVIVGDALFEGVEFLHSSAAASAEARPVLFPENIFVCNLSIKNNVRLTRLKVFTQIGWRNNFGCAFIPLNIDCYGKGRIRKEGKVLPYINSSSSAKMPSPTAIGSSLSAITRRSSTI